jgi:L-rhamnose mutarotase
MKQYCLAIDLIDDPELIREYENHHEEIWPEIEKSMYDSGILDMEIFRYRNRLLMILKTRDDFSFDKKNQLDKENPVVQKWENLMWKYQKALPGTPPGEKWQLMERIYKLDSQS